MTHIAAGFGQIITQSIYLKNILDNVKMPIQPLKDIDEYKRIKENLRNRFDAERTGDQNLLTEQTKLLQPLINTQEQTVQAIRGNKDLNVLTKELQRRNDQFDLLSEQPFYRYEIDPGLPALEASKPANIEINLDSGLTEIDRKNLRTMHFKLPSEVFEQKKTEEVLDKIKTANRTIGQHLGKSSAATKQQKEIYESHFETLKIYKKKILGLEGAQQFVGKGLKKKKTHDVILYQSIDDICAKLEQLIAAKKAGNTGLDNNIISILDELLRTKAVSKDEYNELNKNILHIK
jgi:hypothetical protein